MQGGGKVPAESSVFGGGQDCPCLLYQSTKCCTLPSEPLSSSKSFETLQVRALVSPSSNDNQSWMSCLHAPFWRGSFLLEDESTSNNLCLPREQVISVCLCMHAVLLKRICLAIGRYETPCIFVGKVQVETGALTMFSENKLLVIILLIHLQVFLFPNKRAPTEITCTTAS